MPTIKYPEAPFSINPTAYKVGNAQPVLGVNAATGLGNLHALGSIELPTYQQPINVPKNIEGNKTNNMQHVLDYENPVYKSAIKYDGLGTLSGSTDGERWKAAAELMAIKDAQIRGSMKDDGSYSVGGNAQNVFTKGDNAGITYNDTKYNRAINGNYANDKLGLFANYTQDKNDSTNHSTNVGGNVNRVFTNKDSLGLAYTDTPVNNSIEGKYGNDVLSIFAKYINDKNSDNYNVNAGVQYKF